MEIRNCKNCGRLYNHVVGPNLCPKCKDDMEKKFVEVKEYIYNHPGVGVAEVAEAMDVSTQQIRQWVREERLQFAEGSVTDIMCESCGKSILSGRFCPQCKEAMIHGFEHAYKHEEPKAKEDHNKTKAKMRYLS